MASTSSQPLWKRIGLVAAEVLLVLLTLTMIAAILLPVLKGTSTDARDQELFGAPARRK
jgi:hypothetical protein